MISKYKWASKKLALVCALCLGAASLTACSSGNNRITNAAVTVRPTVLRTARPSARPTEVPDQVPETLVALNEYYSAHQSEKEYTVKSPPEQHIGKSFQMALVYDEVPNANGVAYVLVEEGSKSVEIDFSESSFMGRKLCAPPLIKSVVQSAVLALCADNNISDAQSVAEAVLLSYDESKYTDAVFAGDYAFVFAPSSTYKTTFHAINVGEYKASIDVSSYSEASYESFAAQINASSPFSITATVEESTNGSYRNSFASYNCIMITARDAGGNSYRIACFPERVPVKIDIGKTYKFYGTSMFDTNGNPILYLHYAAK